MDPNRLFYTNYNIRSNILYFFSCWDCRRILRLKNNILYYLFYCHRLPERSFFFNGKQLLLCARCTGVLVGYLLGFLVLIFRFHIPFIITLLLFVPLAIDGCGQHFKYWESNNIRRFLTGICAGVAVICICSFVIKLALQQGFAVGQQLVQVLK